MITLYGFGPFFGQPDGSPFVVKAMLLLKFAGLEYKLARGDIRKAPKGKLPYIDDAGTIIADSTFIRRHIEQKYRFDFDAGLTAERRGEAWAIQTMVEDHLYWVLLDLRWNDDVNFARGPAQFFGFVPAAARGLVRAMVRRQVVKTIHAHGLGRHSKAEREALGARDIEALADILGSKPYLMGERPTGVDAAVYAQLSHILIPTFESPVRTAAEARTNLVGYCERMRAAYFGN